MWRQRGVCQHCGRSSAWRREREESRQEIIRHLIEAHAHRAPQEPADYQLEAARQCDYCLESYLDHCTKCSRDFCAWHAGDIDGLCGGCI